jgi:hypothetical protein
MYTSSRFKYKSKSELDGPGTIDDLTQQLKDRAKLQDQIRAELEKDIQYHESKIKENNK